MNEDVIVENAVTWVEVAGLAVGVAVAVGAFLAYFQTKRQIREAARQHEQQLSQAATHHSEQLTSMLRPVVALRHLEGGLDKYGDMVRAHIDAWVENVGPGPAMQLEFFGWVRIPKAKPFETTRRREIEEMKAQIDRSKPEFNIRLGAIGPNRCIGPVSLAPSSEVQVTAVDFAEQSAVMIYIFKYHDVFENQRPSKPIDDCDLGDLTFNKPGTWEKREGGAQT